MTIFQVHQFCNIFVAVTNTVENYISLHDKLWKDNNDDNEKTHLRATMIDVHIT